MGETHDGTIEGSELEGPRSHPEPNHSDKTFEGELDNLLPRPLAYRVHLKETIIEAHQQAVRGRVIEELESFEPFFKGDHKNCPDPSSCIGYQNAQNDYDNERDIRIAELKGEQE